MEENTLSKLFGLNELPVAEAHCDGPCGVYDPASARIAAEAVRSMTKKILDLTPPEPGDTQAVASYLNTVGRYVAIKKNKPNSPNTNYLFSGPTTSNQYILRRTLTFTKFSGTQRKPVQKQSNMSLWKQPMNLWPHARKSITCSGKAKAEKSRTTKQVDPNGSQRTYSVSVTKT